MVDEVSEFYTAKRLSTSSASFLGTFPTGEGLGVREQTATPRGVLSWNIYRKITHNILYIETR